MRRYGLTRVTSAGPLALTVLSTILSNPAQAESPAAKQGPVAIVLSAPAGPPLKAGYKNEVCTKACVEKSLRYMNLSSTSVDGHGRTLRCICHPAPPSPQVLEAQQAMALAQRRALALAKEREAALATAKASITWVHSNSANVDFAKAETTAAQYRRCMQGGACKPDTLRPDYPATGRDQNPIDGVTWFGAKAFCAWVGARLPTEAEWMSEATAGGTREYPWGNQGESCTLAVIATSESNGCSRQDTWPVCSKPAGNSVSGVCDLYGNSSEWTSTPDTDPQYVVVRGTSYFSGPSVPSEDNPDAMWRHLQNPANGDFTGFRCVKDPPPPPSH